MISYANIEKANGEIKTLPLGKKNYAEVAERVKAFRKLFPEGVIDTEIVKYEDGIVIIKATIIDADGGKLATGHAMEREGTSNINRFNALENCETSAVGRALGFIGLTGGGSIASYEEVSNAQMKQEGAKLATTSEKAGLIASANAKGIDHEAILKAVGFDRDKQPEGMTAEQYGRAMKIINEA